MKILIATGLYPPEIGGPATHSVLMEQEMPKHGHTVSVLPFRVSRSLPKGIRHVHYFLKLYLRARKSDVVFAQDVASVGLPAVLACKYARVPCVVRVPGDYAWEQSVQRYGVTDSIDEFQTKKYNQRVERLRSIQKYVVRQAAAVVTPSDYFNRLVTGWGVSSKKVHTIYNGVNLGISPAEVECPPGKLIVSAGRLVAWKGFATLIQLLPQLPDWQLVILGDGPDKDALQQLAMEHGVDDRVQLLGSVSREEVFGWCTAADVFVLNTAFESFSYQIVEAMYSGTPVITTNVGSIPELITSGVEGLLVEPHDKTALHAAIQSTQKEPDVWHTRTATAVKKARTFSIERTARQLHELLLSTV